MKIAHIADIHVRSLIRHEEYKEVFEKFIEDVRKQNVDIIFIGGDLYHNKTQNLSPEYFDFMSWWLHEMQKVAPVHIILGNHDGNLANLSRQDAVSPIVTALSSERIFLYKKSGIFSISRNVDLCVFSVFDMQNWDEISKNKDSSKINIACYHGPIKGAATDEGWEIDSELSIDFFDGFDFVLLGDIHTKQYLSYRKTSKNDMKPWIAYPGSMIQQNYGESVEDHGYLLWDINDKNDFDVKFIRLENNFPFVTLEWNDNIKEEAKKYPNCARFRIKSQSSILQSDQKEIVDHLKSRGSIEVIFKVDQEKEKAEFIKNNEKLVSNLRDSSSLLEYIRKYAEYVNSSFNESDWNTINEIIKNSIKQMELDNEIVRNVKWTINNLEWQNLYSYGDSNIVDFSKLNGVVGVLGSNRSGKSSLVGTLTYALFNSTDRGAIKNVSVINERKDDAYAKVELSSTNGDFFLERQTIKKENKKKEVTASTSLNFFSVKDHGDRSDLNGEQRNDTEKSVRKVIGTFDDFILTGLSRQGDLNRFINEGSSQRKSILTKFLDLDFLEKLFEYVKSELSNLKYSTKDLYENFDIKIKETEELLSNSSLKLENVEKDILENKRKIDDLKSEYLSHSKGEKIITKHDLDELENSIIYAQKELDRKTLQFNQIIEEKEELEKKYEKIKSVVLEHDIESLKKDYNRQLLLERECLEKKLKYESELVDLKNKEKSALKLLEVPCGDAFPMCKFIKDSHKDKNEIANQKQKVEESLKLLNDVGVLLESFNKQNIKDKIEKLEKLKNAGHSIELQIANKDSILMKLSSEKDSLSEKLNKNKEKLENLRISAESDAGKKCDAIRKSIETIQTNLNNHEKEKRNLYSSYGKYEYELDQFRKKKEKSEETLSLIKLYEFVSQSLSKKGVPALILKSELPIINSEIASILNGIVDFTIEFSLDEDLNFMDIFIVYENSRRLIELCSGMEKTIASIAIRSALANITTLPKPDFIILDEGFGTLDSNEVDSCGRLIKSLKKYFRFIIIITHVDSLKDYVDDVIEISKKEGDSYVCYR